MDLTVVYFGRSVVKEEVLFSLLFLSRERGKCDSVVCRVCVKFFVCRSALEIYYRSYIKERSFVCAVCRRGCFIMGNLK